MPKIQLNAFYLVSWLSALYLGAGSAAHAEGEASAGSETVADAAAATEHAEKAGLPHLDTSTYTSQIFWLVVSFVLIYALMSKLSLPRVAEVLEARNVYKKGVLKRAAETQESANKMKAAYEASLAKAQGAAHQMMAETEKTISEKLAAENAKFAEAARKRVATADQAIAKARADAQQSMADVSAEIAVDIVSKIADAQINKADAKKVVTTLMKEAA